ncbi:MAG: tripartite tricarboxylate transporter permease [Eubacteriales bacterium]
MELLNILGDASLVAFMPMTVLYAFIGVVLGVTVGAIPGLTGDMAISILLPFVYKVDTTMALGLLIGIYKGSMFGGSISAISFGVPGTPAAAATVEDGYPLAKKGRPMQSMLQALFSSVTGDIFSTLLLVFLTIPMGQLAIKFGPVEFFALYIFSLVVIAVLSRDNQWKGILATVIGLVIAMIGTDPATGASRLTFGISFLRGGFATVPVLVGTFAISELIIQFSNAQEVRRAYKSGVDKVKNVFKIDKNIEDKYTLKHFKETFKSTIIGSAIGTFVGILPGAGSSIACYLSYGIARNVCKDGDEFGTGVLNGIAAPEAGNSATCGASVIPLLAFGIPGSATAALIGAALTMQGINPGPTMFTANQVIIYAFFIIVLYASILNLGVSRLLIPMYAKISKIQIKYLVPVIFALAILGCYTTDNSVSNIWALLIFGVIGVILRKFRVPLGPFILGYLIGPSMEISLKQSLSLSNNDWSVLFSKPIALGFYAATIIFVLLIVFTFNKNKTILDKGANSDEE